MCGIAGVFVGFIPEYFGMSGRRVSFSDARISKEYGASPPWPSASAWAEWREWETRGMGANRGINFGGMCEITGVFWWFVPEYFGMA